MSNLPYVRIEVDETANSRKDILTSEINIINLITSIRNYKELRKANLGKVKRLRTIVRQGITKVSGIMNELPEVEKTKKIEIVTKAEDKRKKTIDSELAEIRRKLSTIGIN